MFTFARKSSKDRYLNRCLLKFHNMAQLFTTLLRWGMLATLSDREAFIHRVSTILEQYQGDPIKAEKYARLLAAILQDAKDNMSINRVIKKFNDKNKLASKQDVEELQNSLDELTLELRAMKR